MILRDQEIEAVLESPAALQVLIDYHNIQATLCDGADMPASYHDERIKELKKLKAERETIIKGWEI